MMTLLNRDAIPCWYIAVTRLLNMRAAKTEDGILQLLRQAPGKEIENVQVEHDGEFVKLTANLTIKDDGQMEHQ